MALPLAYFGHSRAKARTLKLIEIEANEKALEETRCNKTAATKMRYRERIFNGLCCRRI